MSDLPKCLLCGCEPLTDTSEGLMVTHTPNDCPLTDSDWMTPEQWQRLMGDQVQAIANRVCRDIPDEFHIEMVLENGAGWVSLFHKGKPVEIDMADWSIAEQFDVAMQCVQQILGEQHE